MPYCSRLVDGWPLHVFLFWLKIAKFSKLSSLLVTFKVLLFYPNRQKPCLKPKVLPPNLVVALALDLWPGLLCLKSAPACPPEP